MNSTLKNKIYDNKGYELKPHYSINNKSYIKYVTKVERDGIRIVYPKNRNNNNISPIISIEKLDGNFYSNKTKRNKNTYLGDIYKVTMVALKPMEKHNFSKIKPTKKAVNMFETQYIQLLNERPHTNIKSNENPTNKTFSTVKRQLLGKIGNVNGKQKVTHLYLTNFNNVSNSKLVSQNSKNRNNKIEAERKVFIHARNKLAGFLNSELTINHGNHQGQPSSSSTTPVKEGNGGFSHPVNLSAVSHVLTGSKRNSPESKTPGVKRLRF